MLGSVRGCAADIRNGRNAFGAGGLLSRRTGGVNGTSVFYTFDHQGNVCQRFDRTANLLSTDQYSAFGGYVLRPASDGFGYGGQWGYYTDAETGLILLTNRYYDAGTGRFLNRDPLSYAGGINLYGFVGGNPVNFADPLGLLTGRQAVVLGSALYWGVVGFSAGGPVGGAIGFGAGAALALFLITHDVSAAADGGLDITCAALTVVELGQVTGSVIPRSGQLSLPCCLHGLARLACAQGLPARAARLLGTAGKLHAASGIVLWPAQPREFVGAVAAARRQVKDNVFTAAWEDAQAMALDEVLELALNEVTTG